MLARCRTNDGEAEVRLRRRLASVNGELLVEVLCFGEELGELGGARLGVVVLDREMDVAFANGGGGAEPAEDAAERVAAELEAGDPEEDHAIDAEDLRLVLEQSLHEEARALVVRPFDAVPLAECDEG